MLIVIISSGCYFFEVIILCQTQYDELAILYLFLIFHWPRGCCYYFDDTAAAAAKSLQSCPTLCDPIDGSPLGYPIVAHQRSWSDTESDVFFSRTRREAASVPPVCEHRRSTRHDGARPGVCSEAHLDSNSSSRRKKLATDNKKLVFIIMLCCNPMGSEKFSAIFSHVPFLFFKKLWLGPHL